MNRPNPNETFPNPKIPSLCYIKNVVQHPNIIVGDYTYYDEVDGADQFEKHVTHFYNFIGDKLIIGKFCAIAKGVEFVMNGANHRMDCATTYPFYIMGGDWGSAIAPVKNELLLKGDTIVGNDSPSIGDIAMWDCYLRKSNALPGKRKCVKYIFRRIISGCMRNMGASI